MNEQLIWVDYNDNEVGYGSKNETHKKGKLHRAFSVFIINADRILIQQRAFDKYHSGGLWTNACCSHPRKNEKLQDAVSRRLKEELGIECNTKEIGSFIYHANYGSLSEYEYDHVFIGEYLGKIEINKNEINSVRWVNIRELQNEVMEHPERFTTWFVTAFGIVIGNHTSD